MAENERAPTPMPYDFNMHFSGWGSADLANAAMAVTNGLMARKDRIAQEKAQAADAARKQELYLLQLEQEKAKTAKAKHEVMELMGEDNLALGESLYFLEHYSQDPNTPYFELAAPGPLDPNYDPEKNPAGGNPGLVQIGPPNAGQPPGGTSLGTSLTPSASSVSAMEGVSLQSDQPGQSPLGGMSLSSPQPTQASTVAPGMPGNPNDVGMSESPFVPSPYPDIPSKSTWWSFDTETVYNDLVLKQREQKALADRINFALQRGATAKVLTPLNAQFNALNKEREALMKDLRYRNLDDHLTRIEDLAYGGDIPAAQAELDKLRPGSGRFLGVKDGQLTFHNMVVPDVISKIAGAKDRVDRYRGFYTDAARQSYEEQMKNIDKRGGSNEERYHIAAMATAHGVKGAEKALSGYKALAIEEMRAERERYKRAGVSAQAIANLDRDRINELRQRADEASNLMADYKEKWEEEHPNEEFGGRFPDSKVLPFAYFVGDLNALKDFSRGIAAWELDPDSNEKTPAVVQPWEWSNKYRAWHPEAAQEELARFARITDTGSATNRMTNGQSGAARRGAAPQTQQATAAPPAVAAVPSATPTRVQPTPVGVRPETVEDSQRGTGAVPTPTPPRSMPTPTPELKMVTESPYASGPPIWSGWTDDVPAVEVPTSSPPRMRNATPGPGEN